MTETFVYREVLALRQKGWNVVTYANRRPDPDKLADESRGLMASTRYFVPLQIWGVLAAHLYFILRHPRHYFGTFWRVFSQKGESLGNIRRTIGHFIAGVFFARQAQRDGVDHVHAHFSVNAATIAYVLAGMLGISFSFTVHNNFFTDRLILKEKLRKAKFIVSISEYSRDWLLNYGAEIPHLREKFHIVHCGISPQQFTPREASADFCTHPPTIFSLAYHAERKGMPYLVETCKILHERDIPFHCIIGGNGPQTDLLRTQIRQYQLENYISLPGVIFQEQLPAYHAKTDIFVLPCITAANGDVDGIPVVLMESLAKAIPTVSTTVSGIPELISDGQEGLLVPEKDAVALADALQSLLEDRNYGQRLAKAGREKVLAEFDIDKSATQLSALFDQFV